MIALPDALRRVEQQLRAGQVAAAMRAAHDAVTGGLSHPVLHTLAAQQELETGAPDRALALATRACALAPSNADALRTKAMVLARLGQAAEAVAAYDAALRSAPRLTSAHYARGLLLLDLHEERLARLAFEQTISLDPNHAGALSRLASMALARGQGAEARAYAERALRQKPDEVAARIVLAELELEARDFEAASARLTKLRTAPGLSAVNRSIVEGLLADVLDCQGRTAEAFALHAQANAILKDRYKSTYDAPGTERAYAQAERLAAYFRSAPAGRWRNCSPGSYSAPVGTHVFLIGFPRSGTTLLEQLLAGHSEIEALEERGSLGAAMADFLVPPGGLARLDEMDGDALARYREAYWAEVRSSGVRPGRVFIDKMPLNTMTLGLIAKLFPDAKIVLALRDPRDVVLSCFRRRFEMSANMYELLTLEDAARFYASVMDLANVCLEKFSLAARISRYEDLVAGLEGSMRGLCAFLDVTYEPGMLDFERTVRQRAIATPSGKQLARGLQSGAGQWRAWRTELEPVLPLLAPFVARYGYEA